MPTQYYKTEGLILRKMPFGEADFLVRILTKDFGKMDFLAKGARKSVSKLNPHLDMLNFVRVTFVQNGDEVGRTTLTDAEGREDFRDWFLDAESIAIAGRIIKTIDLLVHPGDRDPEMLQILLASLRALGGKDTVHQIGTQFVAAFLEHQGYGKNTNLSLLPSDLRNTIMDTWPSLTI